MLGGPDEPPSPDSHAGPNGFHETKRPRALQEPVDRPKDTCSRKCENEPRAAIFEGVEDQHEADGRQAEERQSVHACLAAHFGREHHGEMADQARLRIHRQAALPKIISSVAPVLIRTARSRSSTKILPSPISPVLAARMMASVTFST